MEEFRKIKDYPMYPVSNLGNVRTERNGKLMKQRLNPAGYKIVGLRARPFEKPDTLRVHRLIANAFIPNPENKRNVDHIDNNRTNNNIENLRWATNSENNFNSKLSSNNTSGFKGVTFIKKSGKWRAVITVNGNKKHLGEFTNKEDAIKSRYEEAVKQFGTFINQCEVIKQKRVELDEELEQLEREFEALLRA
jgi:hypothetical protein